MSGVGASRSRVIELLFVGACALGAGAAKAKDPAPHQAAHAATQDAATGNADTHEHETHASAASDHAHAHDMEHDMESGTQSQHAHAQAEDARPPSGHVAPPPPAHPMPAMHADTMGDVMDMHDDPLLAMLVVDQLERAWGERGDATVWDAHGWIGHDFDKLWLRSEGEREGGASDARIEAFWDHAFASFWDWQLGARHDFGSGPQRDWAAFGVQGLAPYWFELEATAYVGEAGRTALRLRGEYEVLLTQRLVLQPELELNAYGRRDPARAIAAGINDADIALRLRYEIRREFAPYVGILRRYRFGDRRAFADPARADTQWVAGVRFWF